MQKSPHAWFGVLLIVLGAFFLLDATGAVSLNALFSNLWPVALILLGAYMIFRPRIGKSFSGSTDEEQDQTDSIHMSNIFGDVSLRITSPAFRGGSASTILGKVEVDCREGGVADGEYRLTASSVLGGVTVLVPPNTPVSVSAQTLIGSTQVFDKEQKGIAATLSYESPGYASAARKLRIDVSQVLGDCRVR
jgi:predicted membrane protein